MLGKLLKYEFKATARIFLLMYGAVLVVAAITGLLIPLPYRLSDELASNVFSALSNISLMIYVLLNITMFVLTTVIFVVRFYRMLGDEGYLWFTLPATANQHVLAKLTAAAVWSLASVVTMNLGGGVLTIAFGGLETLQRLLELWRQGQAYGFHPELWLLLGTLVATLAWLSGALMLYAAMSIGPNLTKSRLGGSVLAYLLLWLGTQVVGFVQALVTIMPLREQMETLVYFNGFTAAGLREASAAIDQMALVYSICYGLGFIATAVVFYLVTRHFLTRKLNLA